MERLLLIFKYKFFIYWYWTIRYRGMHTLIYGYPAYRDMKGDLKWKWLDTNETIDINNITRLCPKCSLLTTSDGHDPCIPNLKGVKHACCGHGKHPGKVILENGKSEWLSIFLKSN